MMLAVVAVAAAAAESAERRSSDGWVERDAFDFRERPGCRDALLEAGDDERFRDRRYVMKTREYAFVGLGAPRTGPEPYRGLATPRVALGRTRTTASVNGTLLVNVVNRKAASRHIGAVLDALAGRGEAAYDRVLHFFFAADPLAKARSAYREIVDRHVDRHFCANKSTYLCTRDFVRLPPDSRERFEAFARDLLGARPPMRDVDDGMCYHVFSQSWAVADAAAVGFVGALATLTRDLRRLLGLVVADVDALVASTPALGPLLAPGGRARHPREAPAAQIARFMHLPAVGGAAREGAGDAACLSAAARAAIVDYYAQDYACFDFPLPPAAGGPPPGGGCDRVEW